MSKQPETTKKRERMSTETLRAIQEMIRSVKYGSITVLIQDGNIMQIDKTEICRLSNVG